MSEEHCYPDLSVIRANQYAKLRRLLLEVLPENPFYGAKAKAAGLSAEVESLEAFSRDAPFTTKADLVADQAAHPPYGSNLTCALGQYTRFSQTSATSGTPMRWLDTDGGWNWMLGNWNRVLTAAKVKAEDHCYFAFSFGPFLGFWTAFEAAVNRGCLSIPGGGLRSSARVRAILDNAVTVLFCTPTYAIHLGQSVAQDGVDMGESAVRQIIVAGEPGGSIPGTRQRIEDLWPGATVFDHHGMTEIGPVSFECPKTPGKLHIIGQSYYEEVVDPKSGEPVSPGELGELVLTALGRPASPLMRYRTGDLVRVRSGEKCACGRWDPVIDGGVLGRVDDMVIVRGVNINPGAVEDIVRRFPEIEEYQVKIYIGDGLAELTLTVESDSKIESLTKRLDAAFANAFNLRINIEIGEIGTLPRFELKAKRWNVEYEGNRE